MKLPVNFPAQLKTVRHGNGFGDTSDPRNTVNYVVLKELKKVIFIGLLDDMPLEAVAAVVKNEPEMNG